MSNGLGGLEKFGLGSLKDIEIYEAEQDHKTTEKEKKESPKTVSVSEQDILFEKSYKCPCCDHPFKASSVRAGRTKLERMDNDLRPIYLHCDPIKYDAIVCPKCGYAALIKNFGALSYGQMKLIREQISSKFKNMKSYQMVYSYDDAIERTQLALLSSIVKGAKNSEKAYTCLKIAWLIRGKREHLDKKEADFEKNFKELLHNELHYLENAYEGFHSAYLNEDLPIAGMDEATLSVVMGETGRKLGKKEEAYKYLAKVIMSKTASERLKDIARKIKEDCSEPD